MRNIKNGVNVKNRKLSWVSQWFVNILKQVNINLYHEKLLLYLYKKLANNDIKTNICCIGYYFDYLKFLSI